MPLVVPPLCARLPYIHTKLMPEVNTSRGEEEREEKRTTVEKEPVSTLKNPGEVNETDDDFMLWHLSLSSVRRYDASAL